MVKKFLLSAALIGALATSAMAYNDTELNSMNPAGTENTTSDIQVVGFNQTKLANTLIFPAYFVGNGWESTIRVINPTDHGVVAKVVFYDGKDSHEVKDFNIYLSAHDVWVGKLKVDNNGKAEIVSTDDSTPLENGGVASAKQPFSAPITSNFGYVEVIEMATTTETAHHDHANLRKAYEQFAEAERGITNNSSIIFKNGVIQNQVATLPYVKLNFNSKVPTTAAANNAYKVYLPKANETYHFQAAKSDLTGDIRITDTVNGKDMDMMAYKLNYNTNNGSDSLVYLEGEKANVADVEIANTNGKLHYDESSLQTDIANISSTSAYITYGDAPVNDMYVLLTNPFKRVYVQAVLDAADGTADGIIGKASASNATYYRDASSDVNGNINYGSTSLIAQIYDDSENLMSAGQFSPATTPTIKLTNEVATTGYDVNNPNTLAYYLNQAEAQGYKSGYVLLTNANGSKIPGIITQMLATTAGGKVVTNWIIPQQ